MMYFFTVIVTMLTLCVAIDLSFRFLKLKIVKNELKSRVNVEHNQPLMIDYFDSNHGKYAVYLAAKDGSFEKCFHSFKTLEKAARYAKHGAINCKSKTLVLLNGKEVYKADYRPN